MSEELLSAPNVNSFRLFFWLWMGVKCDEEIKKRFCLDTSNNIFYIFVLTGFLNIHKT